MVLVRVQARKWQSGLVLHKRTSPVVSSSFGFPASNWEALVAYRLDAGICGGRELKPDNQTNPRLHAPLETSRAHCWACQYEEAATSRSIGRLADAARSLPFSAFRRPHQLVNRAQQTGLSAENPVLFRAANYPVWSETQHRDRRQEKCCLEEQFTAEDLFVAIKNRLPGQVAQVHAFGALKSASGSSKRILHIHYIGRTSGKLQRCLETKPN